MAIRTDDFSTGTGWRAQVDTFANLPSAALNVDQIYLVEQTTGVVFINRRRSGLYLSDGADWIRLAENTSFVRTAATSGTDNRLIKSDGTDGNGAQETGITVDDSNNVSGILSLITPTISGGTGSGDDLTLQSTTNATKGSIFFGAAQTSVYDEVNDFFGFGTPSPQSQVHALQGGTPFVPAAGTTGLFQNNADPGDACFFSIIAGNDSNSQITFGDAESQFIGRIVYDHNLDRMRFFVNGVANEAIDSSGNFMVGGIVVASSDIILNADGSSVFNEQGNDADTRIEGVSEPNLGLFDASTNRFGIRVVPEATLHVLGDSVFTALIERETANNSALQTALFFKATSTQASRSDGFGPALAFMSADSGTAAGIGETLALIAGERNGGDTTGKFIVNALNAGVQVRMLDVAHDGVVINDTGVDADFRVESNTDPNSLFHDAALSRWGFGTNLPQNSVHIVGAGNQNGLLVERIDDLAAAPNFTSRKARGSVGSLAVVQVADTVANFTAQAFDGTAYDTMGNARFRVATVSGSNIGGEYQIRLNDTSGDLQTRLHIDQFGNILYGGETLATADIAFSQDGTAVFNEQGNDVNFRVESDTDPNAAFLDAALNRWGFGTNTPDQDLTLFRSGEGVVLHVQSDTADTSALKISNSQNSWQFQNGGGSGNFEFRDVTNGQSPFLIEPQTTSKTGHLRIKPDEVVFNETGVDIDTRFEGATANSLLHINAGLDRVGVRVSTPLGQLHVAQNSATGAIPTLYLSQSDLSEEMIEFATTVGVGNAIEAVGAKTLTTTHFVKVTLPGSLTRYIPVGTIA